MQVSYPAFFYTNKMETRTGFFFRGRGVLAHLKKRPVESIVGPEIFSTFDWPGYLKQFISFLHSRCFKLLSILPYKGGLKNRKFKVRKSCCFCFPYNKKDASSTEWLQPTGDEAKKRVSRSHRGSSSRSTPGYIYIITMDDCEGHSAPPFAKIGYTNDCDRRIGELQSGNPHELICRFTFWVSNRHRAEQEAHDALDEQGLRVYCGGGTEWFTVTGGLDDIDDFAEIVRAAIV